MKNGLSENEKLNLRLSFYIKNRFVRYYYVHKWVIQRYSLGLIVLFPFLLFVIRFYDYPFSKDPNDWYGFFSFYISTITLIATLIIALYVSRLSKKSYLVGLQYQTYVEISNSIDIFKHNYRIDISPEEAVVIFENLIIELAQFRKRKKFIFINYYDFRSLNELHMLLAIIYKLLCNKSNRPISNKLDKSDLHSGFILVGDYVRDFDRVISKVDNFIADLQLAILK